jgi:hypothetical protein
MAKGKPPTLLASIQQAVHSSRTGWWDRLPAEAQAELLEVKQQYKSGELKSPPHQLSRFVVAACTERGWPAPGVHAVLTWLRKS